MHAAGVDGCLGGWVAVVIDDVGFVTASFASSISGLAEQLPDADGFAIDIPIGLLPAQFRAADSEARKPLGSRRNSVFRTPPRPALEAETFESANEVARRLTGSGISVQAYGIRHKIFEVDRWVPGQRRPVWEIHPEVSFATLAGQPLSSGKKSWNGTVQRRALLLGAGIVLPDDLGPPGAAAVDDLLDAAVAAWSCRRLLGGQGTSWPDPPEQRPGSRPIAIWA
jgi:predicted RNase H-like nuclease